MSTMDPEVIDAGRSIDGNSIWPQVRIDFRFFAFSESYQTLVFGQEHSNTGVDLTDRQRD